MQNEQLSVIFTTASGNSVQLNPHNVEMVSMMFEGDTMLHARAQASSILLSYFQVQIFNILILTQKDDQAELQGEE